jgi:hypothetical protein
MPMEKNRDFTRVSIYFTYVIYLKKLKNKYKISKKPLERREGTS